MESEGGMEGLVARAGPRRRSDKAGGDGMGGLKRMGV